MEHGLELVAIVGSDFSDTERELVNNAIDEVDRIGLCIFFIDFQGRTRVASSIAVYWKRSIFSPIFPIKVRN